MFIGRVIVEESEARLMEVLTSEMTQEMSACALRASEQVRAGKQQQAQQLQTTIVVITVLINLTASWAAVRSDAFSKPVVEVLFRELTVLGCIALLVFMCVKNGMPEEISTQVSPCVNISGIQGNCLERPNRVCCACVRAPTPGQLRWVRLCGALALWRSSCMVKCLPMPIICLCPLPGHVCLSHICTRCCPDLRDVVGAGSRAHLS